MLTDTMTGRSLIEHLAQHDDTLEVYIRSKSGTLTPLTEEQISVEAIKHSDDGHHKPKSICIVLG